MKNFYLIVICFLLTGYMSNAQNTLTILHVNDSHSVLSAIGPRDSGLNGTIGGIARAATVIGYERTLDPDLLLLHAGDISVGDLFFNRYFQVPELTWMNMTGFDAMTVGNHEFDLTPEVLLGSLQNVFPDPADAFPLLGANINASALPDLDEYISDYTVKNIGTLKVGIFGLLTPLTNVLSQPLPVLIEDDIEEIMTIAGTTGYTLRNIENCDIVILLSHLGIEFDKAIAFNVPGINIIISGHDHYKYDEPVSVPNPLGETTWIAQAGSDYMYIGKMKISIDAGGTVTLDDYTLIPLDENVPEEPAVKAMVNEMITDIEAFYQIPFFTQSFGFADAFHREEASDLFAPGTHDTPIGNLVTDAFRSFTGTDIAIHAGGSSALPLWEGQLTPGDIFRINGYGFNTVNTLGFQLATFNLTGEAILAGLEFGLSDIENNDEFFLQVSGLEYQYNASNPAGERVVSVIINGQTLNPASLYSVTASELVLSVLDFIQIPYTDEVILTGVTEFEAVAAHVMAVGNLLHPKEIGRIVNIGDNQFANKIKSDGWFNSEAGSLIADPAVTGNLTFTMNIHNNNANTAQGVVKIKFPPAEINITGSVLEFLLVEDNKIIVRGEGRNKGRGRYGFLVNAVDGGSSGDMIKLTIWDKLEGDKIVYDNLTMNELEGDFITIVSQKLAKENEIFSPDEFALFQNYPNPFNPVTTIGFRIASSSGGEFVQLKVYDILGNEVATIVNEELPAGNYSYRWDAGGLASGIYIYKLQAGNFVDTKKLILMK